MKHLKNAVAAVVSGSVMLQAMCCFSVWAADAETDPMTATITLNGDSAAAEGENVTIDGTKVTISASGSYEIKGELIDGQICVNVPDEVADPGTVKLYFNGVTVTGVSEAPVYIINAEKTSINLVAETENFLYDGEIYTETTAVIHAKDDLTIKGEGKLRVEAAYHDGIQCNNDLNISGGTIKVKTEIGDGIRGKKSLTIKNGIVDVNAKGDGLKSTKGDLVMIGGTVDSKAGNDAMQGETLLEISGGVLKANGDRGLRCDSGTIVISGGKVLATATDYQVPELNADQPVILASIDPEQLKDQEIAVLTGDETVYAMTPDKKFDFILISAPELKAGETYSLALGGKTIQENIVLDSVIKEVALTVQSTVFSIDINCDGEETLEDVVFLAKMCAELPEIADVVTPQMAITADLNNDSFINANDLVIALRYYAGLDVEI